MRASGPHRYLSQAMTTKLSAFVIYTLHTSGLLPLMTDRVTHYEEDTVFSVCNFLVLRASGPHRYLSQTMTTKLSAFAINTLHTSGLLPLITDSHTL